MPIRKKGDVEIQTSANGTKSKNTGFTFYSYDKNSAALYFNFREENGEPTDLANATIRLVFVLNDEKITPKTDDIEIWLAVPGTARYIIPESMLGHEGKVTGYVYLEFSDGSHTDEGRFTFEIKQSMITDMLPEAGEQYVKDFEDVKERVEQAGDSATKDIEKAKDNAESQIGDYVGEVESAKDTAVEDIDKALPEVEDKLDEVTGKISELDINDRNLLTGTSDEWKKVNFSGWNYYLIEKYKPFYVNEGETYTASVLVKDVKTAKNGVALYLFGYTSDDELVWQSQESDTDRVKEGKLKKTITIPEKVDHITMAIRNAVNGETVTLSYKEDKLQKGKWETGWTPAPEDLVDEAKKYTDSQMNSLKQESVKLNVPTDFPTLASAFEEIESNIYATGANVYVNIETGHQISEEVILTYRDYRRVTIQSEDDIVEVADGFTGDILKGSNCHFPIFNILVDMKGLGSFGLDLHENANATVEPHCGVINAGYDGVFVNRLSQLYAHEANFSGANRYGMFVDHANTVYARYVNLDNCEVGLRSTKGSVVEVANASIQNCQNAILATEGSKVIGITDPSEPNRYLNVSGSTGTGIYLKSSAEFVGDKVIIENCGIGIIAETGAKVVCSGTGIVNCEEAMRLSKKSTAYMGEFYMKNITETGIYINEGSFLQAESSECHVDGVAFTIGKGSRLNVDDSDLTNCGKPIKCTKGGHANCCNVDATGHTAEYGFYVYYGSTINAYGASGDLRVTPNKITSDGYIIQ